MEKPPQAEGQLSLSGSRSLLKQLRPKGASNALLEHSERNEGDSSSGDEHVRLPEIIDVAWKDFKHRKSSWVTTYVSSEGEISRSGLHTRRSFEI